MKLEYSCQAIKRTDLEADKVGSFVINDKAKKTIIINALHCLKNILEPMKHIPTTVYASPIEADGLGHGRYDDDWFGFHLG